MTMQAYRLFSQRSEYPLHLGVTETGARQMGVVKSAMGIGGLLCMGIGDTLRVSLTGRPGGRGETGPADFAGGGSCGRKGSI